VKRPGVGALLFYVALDLANPLMPGALCFDPQQSVEAVGRARAAVVLVVATTPPVPHAAEPLVRDVTWSVIEPPVPCFGGRATPRARTALRSLTELSPDDD
jgi:hypothetical protein